MAKKLLIRTPQTTDGINLAYDEDKQPVYKETTVPAASKRHFESLNASLPEHLRHEFIEFDGEKPTQAPVVKKGKKGAQAPEGE